MKPKLKFILFFILLIPLASFAFGHDYPVRGDDQNGVPVTGEIESNSWSKDVEGTIVYPNGQERAFSGEWSGKGQIEGQDEDGNIITLETDK